MQREQKGVLVTRVEAVNVSENPPAAVTLDAGTSFVIEVGKFEWLGREGLYTEISLPELPGSRYRVRCHHLYQASGQNGGFLKTH